MTWRIAAVRGSGVLGSYGRRNLGDEAILTGLLADLRAQSRTPASSSSPGTRRTPAGPPRRGGGAVGGGQPGDSAQVLAQLDLLILGGGGILYDREARRTCGWSGSPRSAACPLLRTRWGSGRSARRWTPAWCGSPGQRVEVTVRDQESRMVLEEAGLLNPITVTADPAFLLEPEDFPPTCSARRACPPASGWSGSASGSRAGPPSVSTSTATTGCSPRSATSWCTGSTRTCSSCPWNATTSGTRTGCCRT